MFSKLGDFIIQQNKVATLFDFNIGLEVEMHRITQDGKFSRAPYPKQLGNAQFNPWITTDFLETMSEVVTPQTTDPKKALRYLASINGLLRTSLQASELLWPLSMPPALPADTSELTLSKRGPQMEAYFQTWIAKHRFAQGTPCGVHINLSLNDSLCELIKRHFPNEMLIKNYAYETLAQGFISYQWLLTYLFGASPLAEKNYFAPTTKPPHPFRSIRQSDLGFGTKFSGDYSSVAAYVERLDMGIATGQLIEDHDFHGPIRFKGPKTLADLKRVGAQYLELRMLDLDPTSPQGIKLDTLRFIILLAGYFLLMPPLKKSELERTLKQAEQFNQAVAKEDPLDKCSYQAEALDFFESLHHFVTTLRLNKSYDTLLERLRQRILMPRSTPSAQMLQYVQADSLQTYALKLARTYQKQIVAIENFEMFDTRTYTAAELSTALDALS
ncbi:glutamate--cysteine ligase [Ligilactobacillus apodemi]|uniref:glutamate--cysteine ligase n=1 Tax=Ligilactobacillus apodemi TaxID=307126 RepID=UPI00214B019B|nr:glutamate--cysteine ligase [Ligilactobacillus apodemi]MCR1901167.1 glutamate--cysteine ligase [Ligilactobacillus apodemi]